MIDMNVIASYWRNIQVRWADTVSFTSRLVLVFEFVVDQLPTTIEA